MSDDRERFEVAVVIGRFQPFHRGHQALLRRGLSVAAQVVVVLGSARHAPTAKNPFSAGERESMIGATLSQDELARVRFVPLPDFYDDAAWSQAVRASIAAFAPARSRCALIGCSMDAPSRYMRRFPEWEFIAIAPEPGIEAKALRRALFEADDAHAALGTLEARLPGEVAPLLAAWLDSAEFERLREEHLAIQHARATYGAGPFVTVDAIVQVAGHVLLVQRGRAPGKGLWATPGGFLEPTETLLQGALRELEEETGLSLELTAAERSLQDVAVFAHPDRSLRGRTITHAHHFDLGDGALPTVRGADDAAAAHWIPIAELARLEQSFFDDHFHVLAHFLALPGLALR